MKIDVCDMCKKPLEDEYYHIPIFLLMACFFGSIAAMYEEVCECE